MTACELCGAAPGVVEKPDGAGALRTCWPCAGEVAPVDAREARRVAVLAAFDEAVRPCLPYLRVVALRLTRNDADADDVVQEALVKAFLAWDAFDPTRESRRWLSVILKRCFIDEWRRRGRREVAGLDVELLPSQREAWGDYIDAQRAIEKLGPDQRSVLEMAMVGASYEEIADRLEVPIGTVMSRLFRARRAVEASL